MLTLPNIVVLNRESCVSPGLNFIYASVMHRTEPDRTLYLAVHNEAFIDIFDEPLGKLLLEDYQVRLIVYDIKIEEILKWLP